MSLFFCTLAMSLWHKQFITADVSAVFVDNQNGIQQRRQDFYKHSKEVVVSDIAVFVLKRDVKLQPAEVDSQIF